MSKIEIGVGVLLVLTAPSQLCHHRAEELWDHPGTSFVRELNRIDSWGGCLHELTFNQRCTLFCCFTLGERNLAQIWMPPKLPLFGTLYLSFSVCML